MTQMSQNAKLSPTKYSDFFYKIVKYFIYSESEI